METATTPRGALAAALEVAQGLAPVGVAIRRWRDESDYDAMVRVFRTARPVDGTDWEITTATLAADVNGIGLKADDCILVAEMDGEVVGWTRMFDYGLSRDDGRLLTHSGYVDPTYRRRGIGRALLAGAQAELRRIVAAQPSPAGTIASLQSWVYATNVSAIALLDGDGYVPWRYMIEMTRPLDDVPSIELPAGLTSRPVRPEDRRHIVLALNDAMQDHPGWPDWSEGQLMGMIDHPIRGQIDIWQVAWNGDDVVGGVLGFIDADENAALGRNRGYTEGIFTLRDWRGRGVASALIGQNLRLLQARGLTEAALTVDTENPTGALGLYERHGFREGTRMVIYRKVLGAG
jgi:ribosomal protein S18 acetylase RimI-like enzyme